MNKAFANFTWENDPSEASPLNAQNLNSINVAVDTVDDRVIVLDTTKMDKVDAQMLVKSITFDRNSGVFTITYFNNTTATIDTLLEKLIVNFDYDRETEHLVITLDDGTKQYVDLSSLITPYDFLDSDTIAVVLSEDGTVTGKVKEGSIEEKHLRPNYLADIKVEVAKAQSSASAAGTSERKSAEYEQLSAGHETAAKESEENAAQSAESAESSATTATQKAAEAAQSANSANGYMDAAKASKDAAKDSEESAEGYKDAAATSAQDAESSAEESGIYADMAKSYAVGTEGVVRPNDDTDNAEFYSNLAQYLTDEAAKLLDQAQKLVAAATEGAIIPSGTVAFENLPTNPNLGNMYNISNAFTTDERFAEGAGIQYNPGANVYWTKDGQWDVMIGVQVTGVKGAAESFYRQGNVNITPANIGLGNVPNVSTNDQTPTFTQAATRENIESGEKVSTLWGKLKKWLADLKTVAFSGSYNDLDDKPISFPASNTTSDYSSTGTDPVNGVAVNKALQTLDVTSKGGAGKYIQAISETDGKISATEATMPTSLPANGGTAQTISDTLPVSKGGTGATTANDAANNLIYNLPSADGVPEDSTRFVTSGGGDSTKFFRGSMLALWQYINSKLAKVATSGSYTDLSNKPTAVDVGAFPGTIIVKTDTDLNTLTTPGAYYKQGGTVVTNKPSELNDGNGCSLIVLRSGGSPITQVMFETQGLSIRLYVRHRYNTVDWMPWVKLPTGIKGNMETEYRGGNVNLTPENIGAVSKSGDTMTGTLVMPNLTLFDGVHNQIVIQAFDDGDGDTNNGCNVVLGGKGSTVVGAGEGKNNVNVTGPGEILYLMADNILNLFSNTNTWSSRYGITFDIDGSFRPSVSTPKLGKSNARWSEIWGNNLDVTNISNSGTSILKGPTYQGVYTGTSGTAGWVIFAQIKIKSSYVNYTLEMEVGGRAKTFGNVLGIHFKSSESVDPELYAFLYYGGDGTIFRIKKTATSTWQLAAQKSEAYGRVDVLRVNTGLSSSSIEITYPNIHLVSVDSTWIAPTLGGVIKTAKQVYDYENNSVTTFAYSKSALTTATYLAAWNGYELRAISPNNVVAGAVKNIFNYPGGANVLTENDSHAAGIGFRNAISTGVLNDEGTDGSLFRVRYSDLWQFELMGSNRNGRVATRSKNNGTWTAWKQLAFKEEIPEAVDTSAFASKAIYGDTAVSLGRKESTYVANGSFACGYAVEATCSNGHAEGSGTVASGPTSAHAEGVNTVANGFAAHAEGQGTNSNNNCTHAGGYYTIANNNCSHACGKYNADMTTGGSNSNTIGTAFVIGNGASSTTKSNAFSVQFDGTVKAKSTITASTVADYAEYFEWKDGNVQNEDRVGLFVTITDESISIANPEDEYILGIISGEPFVLGNGDCDAWNGMFLRDEFGRTMYERAPYSKLNEETGEEELQYSENGELLYYGTRPILNPNYNPDEPYVSRQDRPEWAPVGMLGVLSVRQDGSIKEPNTYATVGQNGFATLGSRRDENRYRVVKVISEEVVKVIFR